MRQVFFVSTLEQQIISRNMQKNLETAIFLESCADLLRLGLRTCPEFLNIVWTGIKLAGPTVPELPELLDRIASNVRDHASRGPLEGKKIKPGRYSLR